MLAAVEAPKIAGEEPPIYDGLCGEFGIVEIVRHHGLTAYRNFADAFRIRVQNTQFNPRKRLAHRVGTKRFEVIQCESRAGLGQAIAIGYGDSEVVKELKRGRLDKCAARKHGTQLSAEGAVNLRQKPSAEPYPRASTCKQSVQADQPIQQKFVRLRQVFELCLEPALQIL